MKKIFLLFLLVTYYLLRVTPAHAACQINLVNLKDLVNTRNITLSYVATNTNNAATLSKIEFYYYKEGEATQTKIIYTPNPSGELVFNLDKEGKHFFSAQAFYSDGCSDDSNQTSTTIDTVGPSSLVSFGFARKDGSPTKYEVCFKTPGDSDIAKVKIYRSDKVEFTADSGSEVYSEDIGPDTQRCWINEGLEAGKDYYYAGRVFDKAGNASDPSYFTKTKTMTVEITPTPGPAGGVVGEPQYVAVKEGEILGEETVVSPTPVKPYSATPTAGSVRGREKGRVLSAVDQVLPKSRTGQITFIAGGIVVIGLIIVFLLKRREE